MRRIRAGLGAVALAALALAPVQAGPAASAAATPTCHGEPATIVGTQRGEGLRGTPGPDVIVGVDGRDHVWARGGNDIVCAKGRLRGGRGRDWLETDGNWAHLDGGRGGDVLVASRDARNTVLEFGRALRGVVVDLTAGTASGMGHDRIVRRGHGITVSGSRHDDTFLGSPDADQLLGWGGDNTLRGRGGADIIAGQGGDDTLHGGPGNDRIDGYGGADRVWAGPGNDRVGDYVSDDPDQAWYGGLGRDRLTLSPQGLGRVDPVTDMNAETLRITDPAFSFALSGFATLNLFNFASWTAIGTDQRDRYISRDQPIVATMGGADDFVRGSRYDDWVDGGDGHDAAWTDDGTDTCLNVEDPRLCEITP